MDRRPTGIITFLFTDIEGSTRRWEDQTTGMREALRRHDDTLRTAVETHGGWLFKHTGDGILAAFASPKEAVLAALDAQHALLLPVRMGISTGEAELRDDDYFGSALNRAARITAAGHGRQVLLAQSTASLVDGIELLDLGEYRLRDLSRPQRLFQLRADGLQLEFPPLRTLDALPGNLPAQPTSFIGREDELARIVAGIAEHRLLTLTGVGGVGKTRLALQAAAAVAPDFSGGSWLVELASLNDPGEVGRLIGATTGAAPPVSRESLLDFLRGQRLLLILDNCEHLLEPCASLASAVLATCPAVSMITTSREPLGVAGEWTFRVPSLSLPAEGARGAAEVAASPAVELLVERARAVRPGFELTARTAADVAEVVRRLDGIPLAIELAAARLRMMSPRELREHLLDRFRVLTGSRRGSLERHQTLRAAIDWSFRLLSEPEQQLARRLSVFTGGWSLEAAEAVGSGAAVETAAVLDLLTELVDKSLVQVDAGDGDSGTRYRYLETIRVYLAEALDACGERPAAERAHLQWALQVVNSVPQCRWAHTSSDATLLLRESTNLVAAVERALDDGDTGAAARIAGNCGIVTWFGTGAYEEGIRLSTAAYEAGGGTPMDRFNLGSNVALIWQWSGAIEQAKSWWDDVIDLTGGSEEITATDLAAVLGTLAMIDDERRGELHARARELIADAEGTLAADYVEFIVSFNDLNSGGDHGSNFGTMERLWQRRGAQQFGPIDHYLPHYRAWAKWVATGEAAHEAEAAVTLARSWMDPPVLVQALSILAIVDESRTAAALEEAWTLLRHYRASGAINSFFVAAARAAARAGDRHRAIRLQGVGRNWTNLSPALQQGYERLAIGNLLNGIGPVEIEALRLEGSALTFDEGLSLALPDKLPQPG